MPLGVDFIRNDKKNLLPNSKPHLKPSRLECVWVKKNKEKEGRKEVEEMDCPGIEFISIL